MSIAEGWYPDPDGKPCERYWDGSDWTDRTRPISSQTGTNLQDKKVNKESTQRTYPFLGWVLIGVAGLVLFSCITGDEDQTSPQAVTQTVSPTPEQNFKKCESVSVEDLENIESGMSDENYTLIDGYKANLQENEIEVIRELFPSYNNPLIIAATIEGIESENIVGIWALDPSINRLVALDENARNYSQWGIDATEDSPAGQVREKLYEFSLNTNVLSCAQPIVINGEGDGQSKPFNLDGGSYEVQFETFKDCTYYADLEAINKEFNQDLFSADSIVTGTNYVYEIPESEFYISIITGPSCSWQVNFSQIN
jgi:hypothetical protein